jgi:tRNA-dihydrouridine synthase A
MRTTADNFPYPVSIAPMMQRTDRHYRYMMRLITGRTLLYTEMVTAAALEHGDAERFLAYDETEHPVALQVGGDDPELLANAARLAEEYGYDEINLNVGCPSNRVQNGNFGACLMQTPDVVAAGVRAMQQATSIEVTVKHRIGVDDQDDWEDLRRFVETVAETGCRRFTVHARKAWLQGLSPKENRNVPPLKYDLVYRLKQEFPGLDIEINGGIRTLDEIEEHLEEVDAVMLGRAAYDDPFLFAEVDRRFFGDEPRLTSEVEVVERMVPYVAGRLAEGDRLSWITKHMINLFAGQPGARKWRQHLTEESVRDGADETVILEALEHVRRPLSPTRRR